MTRANLKSGGTIPLAREPLMMEDRYGRSSPDMDWRRVDGMGSRGQVVARWFVMSCCTSMGCSSLKVVSAAVGELWRVGGVTGWVKEFRMPATFPSKWARKSSAERGE